MVAIEAVTTTGETSALCQSVGLARATLYRRRQPARPSTPTVRVASSRALVPAERQAVLDVLHSERFVDQSPAEVQATLLEEQTYLCSTRTMYRILDAAEEVRERRDQARHPVVHQAGAGGDGAQSDLVVGHHQAEGLDPLPLLLAVCDPRSLQSLRRGLDGRGGGERPPGPAADRGHLPQARDRSAPAHDSCRPRRADAQQARRRTVFRSQHRRQSLATPCEQRQSVLRGAIPYVQVPPGVPGSIRVPRTRPQHQPRCSSAGTTTRITTAASAISRRPTSTMAVRLPSSTCVIARAWRPTTRIPNASCKARHASNDCRMRFGSIRRRHRPARRPQERRS